MPNVDLHPYLRPSSERFHSCIEACVECWAACAVAGSEVVATAGALFIWRQHLPTERLDRTARTQPHGGGAHFGAAGFLCP
jgi:hypothetical protein